MPKPKKPDPAVEMIGALRDVVERYAKDDDGLDVSIALAFVLANQVARFEHTETRNAFIDRFMEQLRYWLEEALGLDMDIKPEKPPLRLIDGGKEDRWPDGRPSAPVAFGDKPVVLAQLCIASISS